MILQTPTKPEDRARGKRVSLVGAFMMGGAVLIALVLILFPRMFLSGWIYGLVGVYVFALLKLTFIWGLAKYKGRRYSVNRRYLILSGLLIFSLFASLHLAFTSNYLSNANFIEYIIYGFENRTPGGFFFAVPVFALHALLFLEGALVLLGVMFIVAAAFLTTFVVTTVGENRVIKKLPKIVAQMEEAKELGDDGDDLHRKLETKYQELIEKQSRKRHDKTKSELGLSLESYKTPKQEQTIDRPTPLAEVTPQAPLVTDQINHWSTEAALRMQQGLDAQQSAGGHPGTLGPLWTKLPGYTPVGPPHTNPHSTQSMQTTNDYGQGSSAHNSLYGSTQPGFQSYQTQPLSNMPYQSPTNAYQNTAPAFNDFDKYPSINIVPRSNDAPRPSDSVFTGPRQTELDTSSVKKPKVFKKAKYSKPSIDLIRTESSSLIAAQQEAIAKQHLLDSKLKEFGVNAKVTNFTVAPAVTRFEIQLATGTRVSHVTNMETDIAYVLGSSNVRMELVEGKNAIGVEVPNKSIGMVSIKDLISSREFMNHKSPLAVAIGKNINDELVIADISTMPHLLIAGSTGSGKSVMLNTLLTSLLFRAHPDDVKLLLVDMKRVELNMYNDIPHMLIPRAIKEVTNTINALKWMQTEMTRRYDVLEGQGVNNIGLYQSLPAYQAGTLERMPYIVMVIDEAADLLARGKKEVEDAIKSLSALARACGIHIILATQRPSVDVITAVIKTNFPVRIAFKVGSRGDSQTIINDTGAEKLVGRGDMLFVQEGYSQRVQGAYIELEETRRVMNYIRENNTTDFDVDLEDLILNGPPADTAAQGFGDNDVTRQKAQDPYFIPILKWIVREDNLTRTVSISNMQRQFSLGFSRAGKIMDQLTGMGYVSMGNGSKARDVIITRDEVERLYGE